MSNLSKWAELEWWECAIAKNSVLGPVGFYEPLVAISRKRKIMKIMTVGDPMRTCGLSRF